MVDRNRNTDSESDRIRDNVFLLFCHSRSDARQAVSVEEAVWRAQAFADAGADMVFVDALQSRDEMKALCKAVPDTPKLVRDATSLGS